MSRFARCSRADPKTCFDASKAQTLTGLCGLSRHLLNTNDSNASRPSAACTRTANGPSSLHSPVFSSSPGRGRGVDVAVEVAAKDTAVASEVAKTIGDVYGRVSEPSAFESEPTATVAILKREGMVAEAAGVAIA